MKDNKKKVKFIRKNGRIIPIKTKGLKSKQNNSVTYSDGMGKKGKDLKRVKETGRAYRSNLGHRDALSRLVHLKKGKVRNAFKAGIKQDINDGIKKGQVAKKWGAGMIGAGLGSAVFGLITKKSDFLKGGVALAGAGSIQKGLGNFMVRTEKKAKRNLDKDIKKSAKSWDSYWKRNGSSV
jgi:hypothetical protein